MSHSHTKQPLKSSKTTTPITGTVTVAGDKSLSHRSLLFAALSNGQTVIEGLLEAEDVICTAEALKQMGVDIQKNDEGQWVVNGVGLNGLKPSNAPLYMGNSGTAARLMAGLLAGQEFTSTLEGDASLSKRPMNRVITPLSQMGVDIDAQEDGRLPLRIKGNKNKALTAISYESPVASAQIKSCILLASLYAEGVTMITEPHLSRDHTERLGALFGWKMDTTDHDDGRVTISSEGGQRLAAPDEAILIPSDPSSAAFLVAAAILIEGSDLTIQNVGINPTRNGFFECMRDMGADITYENERKIGSEPVADIHVKYSRPELKAITVPLSRITSMIDEFPIFSVVASCANGKTHAAGLAELRVKESDRLSAMANGLSLCGVKVKEGHDRLTIYGDGTCPEGCAIDVLIPTYFDHRIAMSFLILGAVSKQSINIDDVSAIATSFPEFLNLMTGLGLDFKALDE
jgi:3-phosphoshikimate 1-carboxyvinyltransferase